MPNAQTQPKGNILFLSIEDLNDWIEPLGGHPLVQTPNINRIAAQSTVFEAAYATAPACSPARTSALFGKYPWETGVYDNRHRWFNAFDVVNTPSLIGQVKQAGFETWGAGKVFHGAPHTIALSEWSDYFLTPKEHWPPQSETAKTGVMGRNADFGPVSIDDPLYDERNTDWMISKMQPGADAQFWALGLFRPHTPLIVPQEFFDLYPADVGLPPGLGFNQFDPNNDARIRDLPKSAQSMIKRAARWGTELHKHHEYNAMMRAYLASISFADYLVGKVLDHLAQTGLDQSTSIILWSDHGWQVGEKLSFTKFTLWERALRIPMMVKIPGYPPSQSTTPVSLVDLPPTVRAIAGLPENPAFSGQDLRPLMRGGIGRGYAQSSWGTNFVQASIPAMLKVDGRLASTVRTQTHRLIAYSDGGFELYDHRIDPFEHHNLWPSGDNLPSEDILDLRDQLAEYLVFHYAKAVDHNR